jgi:hypothetical protein
LFLGEKINDHIHLELSQLLSWLNEEGLGAVLSLKEINYAWYKPQDLEYA